MNVDDLNSSFKRIHESSLLFLKVDMALIVGVSTLEYFKKVDFQKIELFINQFGFVLGSLLSLIAVGLVVEIGVSLTGYGVVKNYTSKEVKKLEFELRFIKYIYGMQAFGHIGLLGISHGYLLSFSH